MADTATSFPPDIQRALQQAVGSVNEAAHLPEKKKKKKRTRDADPADGERVDEPEKKRKRKKKHADTEVVAEPPQLAGTDAVDPLQTVSQPPEKKKRKTSKKGKGTQPAGEEPSVQADPPPAPQEAGNCCSRCARRIE